MPNRRGRRQSHPASAPLTNNTSTLQKVAASVQQQDQQTDSSSRADPKVSSSSEDDGPADQNSVQTKGETRRLQETKTQLEKACDVLRQQRDWLTTDIGNFLDDLRFAKEEEQDEGKKRGAALVEQFKRAFATELESIRADIEETKNEYIELQAARNEILNEMVLLNTKNAELNEINNDLARRLSDREREAAAFMAGTNFLDAAGKKDSLVPSSTGSSIAPRLKKLTHKRIMFFGRSTSSSMSSASLSSTKDDDDDDDEEEEEMVPEADHHRFGHVTFLIKPMRCDACGEMLWGTTELKCQVCGVGCHARCANDLIGGHCNDKTNSISISSNSRRSSKSSITSGGVAQIPDPPKEKESVIFGNDLAKQLHTEHSRVPEVVRKCVEAVEARGMEYEGIYRKSGRTSQVRQIQELFDDGQVPDLKDPEKWDDISAVTSTLKHYFRSLPEPLLTYELHDTFIQAIEHRNPEESLGVFQHVLHSCLPKENYETLRYLVHHLNRVEERHEKNLMTASNLAVVFGQTLLRNPDEKKDLLETCYKIDVVRFILQHPDMLFEQQQEQ